MLLVLYIKSYKNEPPSVPVVVTFDQSGGSIGRSLDNDFILADPEHYLSQHHAIIEFADGKFLIKDTSTNGVFINESAESLGKGNSIALKIGDRLSIGEYEIYVSFDSNFDINLIEKISLGEKPPEHRPGPIDSNTNSEADPLADLDRSKTINESEETIGPFQQIEPLNQQSTHDDFSFLDDVLDQEATVIAHPASNQDPFADVPPTRGQTDNWPSANSPVASSPILADKASSHRIIGFSWWPIVVIVSLIGIIVAAIWY